MSLYNTCSKLALKYSRDGSSTMLVVCYFLSQILKAFSVTITAPSLGCDFFFFSFLFYFLGVREHTVVPLSEIPADEYVTFFVLFFFPSFGRQYNMLAVTLGQHKEETPSENKLYLNQTSRSSTK